ncbi:hypothetical protein FO519_009454 [Halicephalobus sp. NKZ332]|nr:hypothetical protein FO519_009454 [Halicephalobus sp. NKZ332]
MIFVIIRLVGAENDRLFENIMLEPQIFRGDLLKLIERTTSIPPQFQEITFRGEKLPASLYPLESINNFEEIEVKHSMLINWRVYIQMIELIRRMTTSGVTEGRRKIALNARVQLSPLNTSNFFAAYPSLMIEQANIDKNINFLIHNTKKYLGRSVLKYFKTLYPNEKIELKDRAKDCAGVHLGIFVFVDDVASYYAKTLGNIPGPEEEIDFPNRPTIDLMEIFIYILLKLIGLGPAEVHIVPEKNKSELVFIATKLIDDFRTASGVSAIQMLENAPPEAREIVVIDTEMKRQMKILSSLLCLSDLQRNKGNHGVVERQSTDVEKKEGKEGPIRELRIIDFGVNMGSIDDDPAIFNSTDDIPFLKTYFEQWDILNNIYKAKEAMENDSALKHNKNSSTSSNTPNDGYESSRPHSTFNYRDVSEDSTPDLKDEDRGKELTEDEKRKRRKQGNTESQARTRKHNATVKELYRRNDKLIDELRNYLFSRGQGISSADIMKILAFINQNAKGLLPTLMANEINEIPKAIWYNTKLIQDVSTVSPSEFSVYRVTKFMTPGQRNLDNLQPTFPFGSINHQNISVSFNLSKPKTPTSTGTSSSRILQGSAELSWMAQLNIINHQAISNDFQNSTSSSQEAAAAINDIVTPTGQPPILITNEGVYVSPTSEYSHFGVEEQDTSMLTTTPDISYDESSRPQSTFHYRGPSQDSIPELKGGKWRKDLTEDEKRKRRKEGNTASQTRTRKHNAKVKEHYKDNDKVIEELRNYVFSRGQGISSAHIMKILVSYKNFPEKQRPKRENYLE